MIKEEDVYQIGTITATHGVRGELVFLFTDDVWDRVEADYLFCRMDGLLVPFFLEEWRFRSDTRALVKFEDINDADTASRMVGADVYFPKELTPTEVEEEDLTWQMFTGFEVIQDTENRVLGTVTSVFDQTANALLVVETPEGKELLIPAHEDFILRADHRERRLYVQLPEDLILLNE